jgi:hypothetical protein
VIIQYHLISCTGNIFGYQLIDNYIQIPRYPHIDLQFYRTLVNLKNMLKLNYGRIRKRKINAAMTSRQIINR